jgi:hypothetical protein
MHIRAFNLSFLLFVSIATSSFIVTTKATPSYWRATFSSPPLNIEGTTFFQDFYALVDQIANDPDVKVIVFDSVRIPGLLTSFVLHSKACIHSCTLKTGKRSLPFQ